MQYIADEPIHIDTKERMTQAMNMKHGQPQEEVSTDNMDGIGQRDVINVCMKSTNSIL